MSSQLGDWNLTDAPYSRDLRIHDLFQAQVLRTPHAVALVSDDGDVTYDELNRRANQVARFLREKGAAPGKFVGLCSDHCPDAIVGLMGILKSGAAYVPIDPNWPPDRQCHILASLETSCLVTRSPWYRQFFDLQCELPLLATILCIDIDGAELPREEMEEESVARLWDLVTGDGTDEVASAGFRHTEDGSPFRPEEVRQYQQHVVAIAERVVDSLSSVLEVGCGSGLILRDLGPRVARYTGVDPSSRAQAANSAWGAAVNAPVELLTAFAHEMNASVAGPYDLVILASTVQFFPGPSYLRDVINQVVDLCNPGASVLIADVIHPGLVEGRFGHPIARDKRDRELHLTPGQLRDCMAGLDGIADLRVLPRTGFDNELSCRYDAILTVETPGHVSASAGTRIVTTAAALAGLGAEDLTGGSDAEDVAYAIFTSGSTGIPKGVVVQHRPVINLIEWVNHTFDVTPHDRLLLVTSFGFDLSVYDIFGILAAGGSVRIVADADLREPRKLLAMLGGEGITFWDSAPAALHQVMQFAHVFSPVPGAALRLVFLSGDWIPLGLPDKVRAHFPGATVVALGGATEATIWSNYYVVGEVDEAWPSVPYGKPIQNARYYVLDANLDPCAIEVPGDLYIGGECLAAGYAGDRALTAQKFIVDPFDGMRGRLYRTGDRARYLPDGNLQFLGRADHQVKVRGYRVELGEIETVLSREPSVDVAVVLAQPGPSGELQLDAYVVLHDGASPDSHELRAHLTRSLPEYMVPQTFTHLPALPVSPTGKVDRKALPRPSQATGGRAVPPPTTDPLEKLVAGVWSEVLRVEVGADDDFFDLGGHSLAAAEVVATLAELKQVDVPLRTVFDQPTVRGFAAALRQLLVGIR